MGQQKDVVNMGVSSEELFNLYNKLIKKLSIEQEGGTNFESDSVSYQRISSCRSLY